VGESTIGGLGKWVGERTYLCGKIIV